MTTTNLFPQLPELPKGMKAISLNGDRKLRILAKELESTQPMPRRTVRKTSSRHSVASKMARMKSSRKQTSA